MLVAVMDVSRRVLAVTGPRTALGYGVAVGGTTAATAVLLLFREDVSKTNVVLTFLLVVVAAAATGGLGPGLGASALGFLAFDFLFLPPYYTFVVDERQDYLSLGVYGGTRLAASDGDVPDRLDERLAGATADLSVGVRGPAVGDLEQGRALTVPMRAGETVVGALVVVAGGPGSLGFGEAERRVLATFANQAALAVEQGQRDEERRHAEALVETDRLRTALLNSVSHDLRTPLASIKASASSLLDQDVSWDAEQRREFLATIDTEADRLTRLVHNLLDMSRIEAGALDPRPVETSVADLVGPVVRHARQRARQRVDTDVPDDLPAVLVDPVRADQLLTNLLDNARAYAPGGPVAVVARPGTAGEVEIRVIDHGPGIPGPERERVFDQFYRLKGGGKRPGGTGMGLAICRGIARAHGGRLWVETTPGGGSTFVLTLPVARTRPAASSEPTAAAG